MRLLLAALVVLAGAAASAPLPASSDVRVVWDRPPVTEFGPADEKSVNASVASPKVAFPPGIQETGILVVNEGNGTVRDLIVTVSAPEQPFTFSLDTGRGRGDHAFVPTLNATAGANFRALLLEMRHPDEFSGGFEFTVVVFHTAPNGTLVASTSTLAGSIEGGALRIEPWQVWLVAVVVLASIAAAIWASRKGGPDR